jgi:hypothetical protein
MSYPPNDLRGEIAFLSMQVHWTLDEILNLEHRDRTRWIDQVRQVARQ